MMSQSTVHVKEVMRDMHTISVDVDFRTALTEMICKKTNSLIVVDQDGKCVGMLNAGVLIEQAIPSYISNDEIAAHYASEDLFREAVNKAAEMSLADFMDKKCETIKADESLMKAAILATKSGQIRIPVVNDAGEPIGLLTRTELKQVIGTFLEIESCFDSK